MAVTVGSSTRGMCRMPGALLRVSQALMHDKSHIQLFEICVFITSTLQRRKLRHREVGKLNVTKAQLVRGRVHIINMGGISGPETETAASQDALGTSAPPPTGCHSTGTPFFCPACRGLPGAGRPLPWTPHPDCEFMEGRDQIHLIFFSAHPWGSQDQSRTERERRDLPQAFTCALPASKQM